MHKLNLNVRFHKIVDNPLDLMYINVYHYSKQPHCCHIGYACAGPCREAFRFCNITIPCHICFASTMSTHILYSVAQVVSCLVTMTSTLRIEHYLANLTIKVMNNIILYKMLTSIQWITANYFITYY
jgi:hypothetical protein